MYNYGGNLFVDVSDLTNEGREDGLLELTHDIPPLAPGNNNVTLRVKGTTQAHALTAKKAEAPRDITVKRLSDAADAGTAVDLVTYHEAKFSAVSSAQADGGVTLSIKFKTSEHDAGNSEKITRTEQGTWKNGG